MVPYRATRRAVVLGAASSLAAHASEPTLSFRVLRNDSQIGTHVLTFAVEAGTTGGGIRGASTGKADAAEAGSQEAGSQEVGTRKTGIGETGLRTIRVATDIRVGLGPITFYRYTHRAEERWRDGVFVGLDAETNDDGTIGRTMIRREGTSLIAEGREAPRYQPPPEALPMTHWDRKAIYGPLISTQSGRLLRPWVTRLGPSSVTTARGEIQADRFSLRGDPDLDTWYERDGTWAGLQLTARDGSTIRYQRD